MMSQIVRSQTHIPQNTIANRYTIRPHPKQWHTTQSQTFRPFPSWPPGHQICKLVCRFETKHAFACGVGSVGGWKEGELVVHRLGRHLEIHINTLAGDLYSNC